MATLKKGDTVVIKGYNKKHKITNVYDYKPPKSKPFITYHLSETPSNKRYTKKDLVKCST